MRNIKLNTNRLTINQWKKIITICVTAVIVICIEITIISVRSYTKYKKLVNDVGQSVNTEGNDNTINPQIENLNRFLNTAKPNESFDYLRIR